MRKAIWDEYRSKLRSAADAVKVVKSGDWIYYSHFVMFPVELDRALAKRAGEMTDVKVTISTGMYPCQIAACDPEQQTFTYHSSFLSANDRKLGKQQLCYASPSNFHEQPWRPSKRLFAQTERRHGQDHGHGQQRPLQFRHIQLPTSAPPSEMADTVIVEVNEAVPRCPGRAYGKRSPLQGGLYRGSRQRTAHGPSARPPATDEDRKMAEIIIKEIPNGACLQLGIGGLPNTVGSLIAESIFAIWASIAR